jgi:hypothetical protein
MFTDNHGDAVASSFATCPQSSQHVFGRTDETRSKRQTPARAASIETSGKRISFGGFPAIRAGVILQNCLMPALSTANPKYRVAIFVS